MSTIQKLNILEHQMKFNVCSSDTGVRGNSFYYSYVGKTLCDSIISLLNVECSSFVIGALKLLADEYY